jgi:general secretion pathway protein C
MSTLTISNATDFYQRHESKFILVVVILVSVYLLAFAAKVTWSLLPQESTAVVGNVNTTQESAVTNNVGGNNIAKIINLNLFGNAAAKPVEEETLVVTDVPETSLNLVLSGVVSSSDPNRGAAIIAYRNTQNTYGVGDKIEGTNVTLDEIYVDRVIIKNRLTRETLMLDGIDFDEANKNRARNSSQNATQEQVNTPRKSLTQDQIIGNQAQALRQARQKLAQEPASFTDMIALAPHRVDGQLIGFRVTPGANPALFNSVGLENGDVVTQLNGLDLTDLQQSSEAITQLREAASLQLEVLRNGEYLSLDLDIPESSGNE